MTFDLDSFNVEDGLKNIQAVNAGDPPALMSLDNTNALVDAVAKKGGCSPETAFIAISLICQKGGTAKRA